MVAKKKRHQINVKISGEEEREIRARATADRRSISAWVRILIEDALAIGPKATRTAARNG
jgi:hypothetical protein